MAAHGMPDGVMHQIRTKPLALMGGGYGKRSKNPAHHLAVLVCDAAEAEMANGGLFGRRDHPVQCGMSGIRADRPKLVNDLDDLFNLSSWKGRAMKLKYVG